MKIFNSIAEWRKFRRSLNGTLGFVPTMGALHEGHLSLVRQAKSENESACVSIYVNPKQFNSVEDFSKYPKQVDADARLLESIGTDFLILPTDAEIYSDNYAYKVTESEDSKVLCGAYRPGHFDGVLTVVLKLLNFTEANKSYFGEKDYQQLRLIQKMVDAFFIPTKIISCPTLREASGLAMSSRNVRLSPEARKKSAIIFETLNSKLPIQDVRILLEKNGFSVDYAEEKWNRRFVAATIENVRLIDNVEVLK